MELRANGKSASEAAAAAGFHSAYITQLTEKYLQGGIEAIAGNHYGGNRKNLIMPYCNSDCMNLFLQELSKQYADDIILLCCDGAAWHKSKTLAVPENTVLFYIPPYTPEMNPIKQIWKELRKKASETRSFLLLRKSSIVFVTPSVDCPPIRFITSLPDSGY